MMACQQIQKAETNSVSQCGCFSLRIRCVIP